MPWILALGMFVIGTTSLSIMGIGPGLTRDLSVSPESAGWLVTAFSATYAFAAPLIQFFLGNRVQFRKLILFGVLVMAISLLWAAFASSFNNLMLSRVAAAFGGSLFAPAAAALAIAITPAQKRGRVLAIIFAGFAISTVAGVPILTWLTIELDWRGAMGLLAALAFVLLIILLVSLPDEVKPSFESDGAESVFIEISRIVLVLLVTLAVLAAQFTVYALLGEFFRTELGLGEELLPLAILVFGLFGILGNTVAGMLTDRVGEPVLIRVSILGLGLLFAALIVLPGALAGTVLLSGCAFMGVLFTAPQQTRLTRLVNSSQHGLILALNSSASYLGIAIGAGLASLLAKDAGLIFLPIGAVILLLIAGIFNVLAK